MGNVLTDGEIDSFIRDGWVLLREGFPPDIGAAIERFLNARLGVHPDDPSTWPGRRSMIQEHFHCEPFSTACTDRFFGAVDDLLGEGRWHRHKALGWWSTSYPIWAAPWRAPVAGWHLDLREGRPLTLNKPEVALLCLFVASPARHHGGATLVLNGSHTTVARIVARSDGSLTNETLRPLALTEWEHDVVELVAEPGDIAVLHPLTLHSLSPNIDGAIRSLCNRQIQSLEPLDVNGPSPVERAVRTAIAGMEPHPGALTERA